MPTGSKAPVVIDPSQKRLGDFFKPFARQSPSSSSSRPTPPTPVRNVSRSQNLVDVLAGTAADEVVVIESSPSNTSQVSETNKKRPRNEADVSPDRRLSERPSKSPRSSPSPVLPRSTQRSSGTQAPSSALSSLQSATPPSPAATRPRHESGVSFTQRASAAALASAASFGSHSSFLASSQRILRDGETIAVRNSDDEASDDSIEDLDDLLGPTKELAKESSPLTELSQTPSPPPDDPRLTRRSARFRRSKASDTLHVTKKTERKVKFSLAALSRRAEVDQQLRLKAEESMRKVQEIDEAREREDQAKGPSLEELVQRHGSAKGQERFLEALNRTEALQQTKQWYFFDNTQFGRRELVFDMDLLDSLKGNQDPTLRSLLQDRAIFVSSSISGVFLGLARKGRLPNEFAEYFWRASIDSSREDVRNACLDILGLLPAQKKSGQQFVDTLLAIGANKASVNLEKGIASMRQTDFHDQSSRRGRDLVCNLLRSISLLPGGSSDKDGSTLLLLLLRLAADEWVTSDIRPRMLLSDAIHTLLQKTGELGGESLRSMYMLSADDTFRLRILAAIPVTCAGTCLLRRRLAAAWMFEDEGYLTGQAVSLSDDPHKENSNSSNLFGVDTVLQHFKAHPRIFSIRRETDYIALKQKIQLLSIAMNNGDPPTSAAGAISTAEQKAFNAEIDRLSDAVREVHNNIIDTGASHASRIEAKDTLDSFNSRLLYSIRTRPRPRKDIIGGVVEDDSDARPGQRSMLRWLMRDRSGESTAANQHSVKAENVSDDTTKKMERKRDAADRDSEDSRSSYKTPEDEHFSEALEAPDRYEAREGAATVLARGAIAITTEVFSANADPGDSDSDASFHSSQS